ncbi:hypothetical protein HYW66_00530 [Candidatus Microgenomates bacterium]|nr:hypothetical protein [Candidatus Microgenomates bacterium]
MKSVSKNINGKSRRRLFIAIALVIIFLTLTAVGFLKNWSLPSFSSETVTPLPAIDPINQLTNLLSEKNIPVSFPLIATSSGILARLTDGSEVYLSINKDFTSQVEALQIMLARFKIEGKQIKKIDLRWAQPIVVY